MNKHGIVGLMIICMTAVLLTSCGQTTPTITTSAGGEVEATEFQGQQLTPIKDQRNNGLKGTQYIDTATYRLVVDGLADKPLSLSYDDLLAYPQVSVLNTLNCVEGWNFVAKWTGPRLSDIFRDAGIQPGALIAIFYTTDSPGKGYTSLDVSYLIDNNIILALKLNDITMPAERGFPFQVMAQSKWGYKWAKWVDRIELSSDINFQGFWETVGYNDNGDISGPQLSN